MYVLCQCFSIYYGLRNPKTTELIEEPQPVHSKWYTKSNTSICLSFKYITCKKNQRITSNVSITWSFRRHIDTVYGELCWLTWLQNQEVYGLMAAVDCLSAVMTEWWVSNVATRILISIHKFRTANKTLLPKRVFISRNPWHPLAEPGLINTGTVQYNIIQWKVHSKISGTLIISSWIEIDDAIRKL